MNSSRTKTEARRSYALISIYGLAAVHISMCILSSLFLPTGAPWNIVFLGIELAAAAAALLCCLAAFAKSRRDAAFIEPLTECLRQPAGYLAAIWCVCSFIACFWGIHGGLGGLYHNGRYLFYLAVSLLVLFPLGFHLGQQDKRALLHVLFDFCLLCFCLFVVYGFYRFLRGDFSFTALFGRVYHLKRVRMRLGQNTNTTGCYAAFFLVLGVYRMRTLKKPWKKALLTLALVPVFAAFALVETRSAVYSCTAVIGFLAGAAFFRHRKKNNLVSLLLAAAVGIAAAAAFVGVFYGARRFLNLMQQKVIKAYAVRVPKKTRTPSDLIREDVNGFGRRRELWTSVLVHVFKTPGLLLHGCTQSSTPVIVEGLIGKVYNTHNQLLEVLLAYGLPSLLLFLAWLVCVARKSLALTFDPRAGEGRWLLPAVLLLLVVNNMAETMLVARGHFVGGFFFLIAGYVCGMAPVKKKTSPGHPKEQTGGGA